MSPEKARKRWAVAIIAAIVPFMCAAQTIDLYCEIEGDRATDIAKEFFPSAGTMVYQIDQSRKLMKQIYGSRSGDKLTVTQWTALDLVADIVYPNLIRIPGFFGFQVIQIDRTTGRFNITSQARDATGRALTQQEVDAEYLRANIPIDRFFHTIVGAAMRGTCAQRQKLF